MPLPQIDTVMFVLGKDSTWFWGIYPLFVPCVKFFSTGSSNPGLVECGVAVSSVVGGHLRCPFIWLTLHRTSASPRGGAIIILPLHGCHSVLWQPFSVARIRLVGSFPLHGCIHSMILKGPTLNGLISIIHSQFYCNINPTYNN